jgi:hypothetical protein
MAQFYGTKEETYMFDDNRSTCICVRSASSQAEVQTPNRERVDEEGVV